MSGGAGNRAVPALREVGAWPDLGRDDPHESRGEGNMTLRRLRARLGTSLACAPIVAMFLAAGPVPAGAGGQSRDIAAAGTTELGPTVPGAGETASPEVLGAAAQAAGQPPPASRTADRSQAGDRHEDNGEGGGDERDGGPVLLRGFDGIDHRQQRLANNGNQFSLEPPDPGLCAGNGLVMESVNDAISVYDAGGRSLRGITDLNTFYGYPPAAVRSKGAFGPFLTDPSCVFDQVSRRWFHLALALDTFSNSGASTGTNHFDLAVSSTSSPLGRWTVYRVDTTDDGTGGTPDHGCSTGPRDPRVTHPNACLGDFPHLGMDRSGVFVTTNEYSFFGPEFHSANVYAFSKRALTSVAATVRVTQLDTVGAVTAGGLHEAGFTLWPATSPEARSGDGAGGTEFLLSSDAAVEVNGTGRSDRLVTWALTNTRSLDGVPDLHLLNTVSQVRPYALPARSEQRAGSVPLAQCIDDTTMPTPLGPGCWRVLLPVEPAHDQVESALDSGDSRMMQVTFADGVLWGALDTELTVQGTPQAAIEWFAVRPQVDAGALEAGVAANDYLSLPGDNVIFPAIGMTSSGHGVIAFTVVGGDRFPSAGVAALEAEGVGRVRIVAEGQGPQDGFSGYRPFGNPPRPRWGGSAAAAVGHQVWVTSEYIGQTCDEATYANLLAFGSCGETRTALANWSTRISRLAV